MTSAVEPHPDEVHVRDWILELSVGALAILLGVSAWVFLQYADGKPSLEKPRPAWLSVSKVMAQMSDGRMVNVKVNLRLKDQHAVDELSPHVPAFAALIQEVGTQVSREDLQDAKGLKHFGGLIRTSLNGYLEDQSVHAKIKDVAFAELMLMP